MKLKSDVENSECTKCRVFDTKQNAGCGIKRSIFRTWYQWDHFFAQIYIYYIFLWKETDKMPSGRNAACDMAREIRQDDEGWVLIHKWRTHECLYVCDHFSTFICKSKHLYVCNHFLTFICESKYLYVCNHSTFICKSKRRVLRSHSQTTSVEKFLHTYKWHAHRAMCVCLPCMCVSVPCEKRHAYMWKETYYMPIARRWEISDETRISTIIWILHWYWVATISRLLKITGLFCRMSSVL